MKNLNSPEDILKRPQDPQDKSEKSVLYSSLLSVWLNHRIQTLNFVVPD